MPTRLGLSCRRGWAGLASYSRPAASHTLCSPPLYLLPQEQSPLGTDAVRAFSSWQPGPPKCAFGPFSLPLSIKGNQHSPRILSQSRLGQEIPCVTYMCTDVFPKVKPASLAFFLENTHRPLQAGPPPK